MKGSKIDGNDENRVVFVVTTLPKQFNKSYLDSSNVMMEEKDEKHLVLDNFIAGKII